MRHAGGDVFVRGIGLRQRIGRVVADEGMDFPSTRAIWSRQACVASRAETSRLASRRRVRKW